MKVRNFIDRHFRHFNAGALKRATDDFIDHLENGGKMMVTIGGAMSSARLGISLAPMIKAGKIHAISCTGANLEESIFRLIANRHYQDYPDYRYFTKQDDQKILENNERRVTDMSIPEEEAFRVLEEFLIEAWEEASEKGESYFPHEFFYKILLSPEFEEYFDGDPDECWLLEAAKANLPIVVPGWEDSTTGNIFASHCKKTEGEKKLGKIHYGVVKSGPQYMGYFYDIYQELSSSEAGIGFFQIAGGISGDFPICVVPSIKYDLGKPVKPWAYFCQISDSTTSYGSYSGATPNEKITWDKLTPDTPMHVIESDATIVVPLIFSAVLGD